VFLILEGIMQNEIEIFYPTNQKEWRLWLAKNHLQKDAVWVVFYKQKAGKPTIKWSNAVDEALCFGWIDSVKKTLDEERSIQFFSKRKPQSTWSKINKDKVQKLIDTKQITKAGLQTIETAKQNGSWTILDEVEKLIIPKDLETELKTKVNSMDFFLSLSRSTRKAMLQWLVLAKREETRQKRIIEIVKNAEQGKKPKQF
jgi:uncharacterized protein YdeI (YjbR/CyaY-like superfamily)